MALTARIVRRLIAPSGHTAPGTGTLEIYDLAFEGPYPRGGEELPRPLSNCVAIIDAGRVAGSSVARVRYDQEAGRVVAYRASAEIADGTDLSGDRVRVLAVW